MSLYDRLYGPKNNRGVNPNDPKLPAFLYFFHLLGRKIINLFQLNIFHLVCSLPALALLAWFAPVFVNYDFIAPITEIDKANNLTIKFFLCLFFIIIPAVSVGPAQAGFTFVQRSFVKEEHVWIFHDYFKHAKENLKQSLIVCVINFIILYAIMVGINFYYITGYYVPLFFLSIVLLLFLMVNMYIWPLLVTFRLSLLQLYRNALIFSYMRFYINILVIFISLAIYMILMSFTHPMLFIAILILIYPSFVGFMSMYAAYPALKKHMIDIVEKGNQIGK